MPFVFSSHSFLENDVQVQTRPEAIRRERPPTTCAERALRLAEPLRSRLSLPSVRHRLRFSIASDRHRDSIGRNSNVGIALSGRFSELSSFRYGQPDCQVSYSLDSSSSVRKVIFLSGLARLLVLTVDGCLHLLDINNSPRLHIERIGASNDEHQVILSTIQTLCLLRDNSTLLLGSQDGNVYRFQLEHFTLDSNPIIPSSLIEKMSFLSRECRCTSNATVSFALCLESWRTAVAVSFILVRFNRSFNTHCTMTNCSLATRTL